MKKLIFLFPLLSLLSACQSRKEELAIYRSRCLDNGYKWGTREYADCMKEQQAREAHLDLQRRKVQVLEVQNRIKEKKLGSKK